MSCSLCTNPCVITVENRLDISLLVGMWSLPLHFMAATSTVPAPRACTVEVKNLIPTAETCKWRGRIRGVRSAHQRLECGRHARACGVLKPNFALTSVRCFSGLALPLDWLGHCV